MSIIKIKDAEYSWEKGDLLYRISNIQIKSGDKILLTGRNGAGKTTFLKILEGKISLTKGEMVVKPKLVVLRFEQSLSVSGTVRSILDSLFWEVIYAETQIHAIEKQMGDEYSEILQEEYEKAIERFELAGGYSRLRVRDSFIHTFELNSRLDTTFFELSSGEQQYVRIAIALFRPCDLLLLDEPFSFLDKKRADWLCSFLRETSVTFILIAHEREYIRGLTNQTIDIANREITQYNGDVDYATVSKNKTEKIFEHKKSDINKMIMKKEEEITRRKEWIRKAENKEKHAIVIKRMRREIHSLTKQREDSFHDSPHNYVFCFHSPPIKNKEILVDMERSIIKNVDRTIFNDFGLTIYTGEHILLDGPNGSGKTTVMKMILNSIIFDSKCMYTKPGIEAVYYGGGESFIAEKTTVKEFCLQNESISEGDYTRGRDALFTSSDFIDERIVSTLSGGEISKVKLIPLIGREYDLLLLDEPGIFLDNTMKNALIQAINDYQGAVLLTSHDKEFVHSIRIDRVKNIL